MNDLEKYYAERSKNEFIQRNKIYFDEGLLRAVYWTEKYCVCNLVNCEYIIFPYNYLRDGVQGGFEMSPEGLPRVVAISQNFLLSKLRTIPLSFDSDPKNYSVLLTQRTLEAFRRLKEKYLNNPHESIDIDYENRLIQSLKDRGRFLVLKSEDREPSPVFTLRPDENRQPASKIHR